LPVNCDFTGKSQDAAMEPVPLAHQTLYAELLQQSLDAAFDADFPENGSFTARTRNGRKYWYYEGYKTSSGGLIKAQKYLKYVGPEDDPEITKRVEAFRRTKTGFRERRRLVMSLRDAGFATPPALVGDVVEALWKAGIFRLRAVLVGTLAYQTYSGLLGVRLPAAAIMTGDVDFAQFHAVSTAVDDTMPPMIETLQSVDQSFRERPTLHGIATTAYVNATNFSVEFLTPNRGANDIAGKPARMPALGGASAQPLRYLDFLIKDPVHAVLLHKGGIPVTVPAPERYAVHKIIVSVLRKHDPNGMAKQQKDIQQAGLLIEALPRAARKTELGWAWMEAWDRGPRWRENLAEGLKKLTPEQTEGLRAAIIEGSGPEDRMEDYGFPGADRRRTNPRQKRPS
jgi:hypothetical protein